MELLVLWEPRKPLNPGLPSLSPLTEVGSGPLVSSEDRSQHDCEERFLGLGLPLQLWLRLYKQVIKGQLMINSSTLCWILDLNDLPQLSMILTIILQGEYSSAHSSHLAGVLRLCTAQDRQVEGGRMLWEPWLSGLQS